MALLLGTVWSPAAAELPDLAGLVDFIEAPAWALAQLPARLPRRLVLHTVDQDASLAAATHVDADWAARARTALERTRSPWLSLHLGFASERVRFAGHMLPESPPLPRETLRERIVANVRRARSVLGDTPLLLENLDYCPEGAYEHICEPAFIREVTEAADAGLLLDLAHLQVTASWRKIEPEALLEALPLQRVGALHLSSPRPLDGNDSRLDDVHDILTERDYELTRFTLARCVPRAITLEYRRDALELRQQLSRLSVLAGRARRVAAC